LNTLVLGSEVAPELDWEKPAAKTFDGRFQVLRALKQGNGVETLLARDLEQGRLVVVKTALDENLSAGARMRLEHEAGVLRHINNPWCAPLLHLGRDEDFLYLVMPFIAGITLQQRLAQGPLTVMEAIAVGRCLLMALQEVHEQGVLHRDLKPANVIVDRLSPVERATIIDFGLARSARLDASLRDQPVGTARYMSPEQAGLLDHGADERSDLYSVGIVLFECLAGHPPFEGDSIGEVLRQHLSVSPPELRSLGLSIPRALDEIIQRLLRKDPRDRFQSAAAVLADLNHLAAALERGETDPSMVVGLRDRRRTLTEPVFVGRSAELASLDLLLDQTRRGEGGLVLLEAESGGGKTRLLTELARRASQHGVWVFRGQGLDQAAQRPFQVLAGVAAELVAAARSYADHVTRIRERLGDQRQAAGAALPELTAILDTRLAEPLGPETFGQVRNLQGLSALLDALGSPERPALVLLDDCQWADDLTLRLLGNWLRRRDLDQYQRHVLVVVAFRSEEVPPDHVLRTLHAPHLKLPPFSTDDVRRLAESMAGPLPQEALALVERFSEGSPFLASAVVQGLVESGALVCGPEGWRIEALALAGVQSSRHAAAFLVRRIELLPPDVVKLLSAAAVLGKEFDLELAASLAEQTRPQAFAALQEARRRHIVWGDAQGRNGSFIHDKLRQTLLERLPAAVCANLHYRAALQLERLDPERVFELAYHFDAAGQSQRALPYALVAADQARAQHALQIAEQQYRIATRGAAPDDQATRFEIAEGFGDVLMLAGRYAEAAEQFESGFALAEGDLAQADIEGKLGELAFKRGDIKSAESRIERALHLLGRRVPRWSATVLLLALWEVLVQVLHTLLPGIFVGRRRSAPRAAERLALRLYSRLAHLYWFHRGTVAALWAHLRELNLAERYPPTPELAQAYSEHAPGMSLIGYFSRGIAYAEKSLAIRKQLGDLWGQGQSLHFHGVVLYAASSFRDCIQKCREAVRLLERTGDYWEVNIARFQIAASLYRLGDLGGAVAEAKTMYQSGLDLGDAQATGISLDVWARAGLGQLPVEIIDKELARPGDDVQRTAQVMIAKGVHLYHQGLFEEAADILAVGQVQLDRAGIRNAWVSPLLPWLATALRRQAEECKFLTPERRTAILKRAVAAVRRGLRLARRFQNDLPHALRESALLYAMRGRCQDAQRHFRESLHVAERQAAIYEHTQTLLARARVGQELNWPGADEEFVQAQETMRTLQAAVRTTTNQPTSASAKPASLSLADRFDTVLDAGRRIASALSRTDIFAAVREACVKLLRGERCLMLRVDQGAAGTDPTIESDEIQADYSQTMVQRALQAGRAVAFVEGVSDDSSDSVLLTGVRSALCAPLFVRGRAAGCLYVTHRQVVGLFGEEEERLAEFIATLGGAALENAEGFAELKRLNQTLQQQIAESRRAEKRIQEQAALLDKASDAISVQGLDDRILYWNHSAETLYGWTAAEVCSRRAGELLFRSPPPILAEAAQALLDRGEWTGELRQVTRAGAEIIVESRWSLVRDDAGQPKARLVVNTNITEKKKLEAQFLRAQRMESIGTLAGGIAHDINNILTPILMGVDMLKVDLPRPQQVAMLDQMSRCALRGADMVKQILSFARGVGGQRVQFQVKHIIQEIERMLQGTFPKSIDIQISVAKDLLPICGDATQLSQMLMNLCVNARDAMPTGGQLTITATNTQLEANDLRGHTASKPGSYLRLTVEDTGMGIPLENLDKIFDPFFTTKEFGKGTGLGLSTVMGIAKGHGGFVLVSSTVGAGTQFVVYLPAVGATPAPDKSETLRAQCLGNGELILVVDDEAGIRHVAQRILQVNGYQVLTAANGMEALSLFAQRHREIALVLTDIMMPCIGGHTMIRGLRQIDAEVRVIAISGLPANNNEADPTSLALQGFLLKPFTAEQLLQVIQNVLGNLPS
jgi:two-component system sensor kinase